MPKVYGNSQIGNDTYIDETVIIGHPGKHEAELLKKGRLDAVAGSKIGKNCILRAYGVIYSNVTLGDNVKTGHHYLIREFTTIGDETLVGSGVIIDDHCTIGKRVSIQSGVYIPTNTIIKDDVFLGPRVALTNDKYMGRGGKKLVGVFVEEGARLGSNCTILPGIKIGRDSLVAAGAVVTKDVKPYTVVAGVPAKKIGMVPEEHRMK